MLDFLKKLLSVGIKNLTVIVWEDDTPDETETYRIQPAKVLGLLLAANMIVVVIVFLFFFLTPLGSILFNREDQAIRQQVAEVRERVHALRDSLDAREVQLTNFKRVLAMSMDTTYQTSLEGRDPEWLERYLSEEYDTPPGTYEAFDFFQETRGFRDEEIVFSVDRFFDGELEFPVEFPLDGSLTRRFEIDRRHFGVDIAAEEGTHIRAFADGVVIFSEWTVNYGYVMALQHSEGFVSLYKHCKNLLAEKGDFVRRADIIGRVGSYGLISSGPHLHFELWRDGLPMDPSNYFTNL